REWSRHSTPGRSHGHLEPFTKSKRRSARGYAEAIDSVQFVDQFFCEAITKIFVFLVWAHIRQWKHSNLGYGYSHFDCGRCAAGCYFGERTGHLRDVLKSLAGIFAQALRNEVIK